MIRASQGFSHALRVVCGLSLGALAAFSPSPLKAQDTMEGQTLAPLAFEGVGNEIDKHRRGPVITVSVQEVAATATEPGRTKILADSYMPNSEFTQYPIRYDFYVERKLFSSQIRTPSQGGPIGIDVGLETAQVPFHYAIVATVLHPNRQYLTVAEGVAEETGQISKLDCSLTVVDLDSEEEDSDSLYVANKVEVELKEEKNILFDFSAEEEAGDSEVSVGSNLDLQVSDDDETLADVTGSITVTTDGNETTYEMSGEATLDGGKISDLSVSTDDGEIDLQCS